MKPLPIGVDDFKKLIDKNYYYVDKTLLIKELLDNALQINGEETNENLTINWKKILKEKW